MTTVNQKIIKFIGAILIVPSYLLGQLSPSDPSIDIDSPNIPQEKVFIHYNTTLLFAGEYLYYKVYNLNSNTKGLSNISKIAYVELLGEDMKPVFKHKLRLEKSSGQSDFFIPTTISSGNYKLIAYTQWMKNGNKDNFFQGDIAIINPYQSDQDKILLLKDSLSSMSNKKIDGKENLEVGEVFDENKKWSIPQDTFEKRSQIRLNIHDLLSSPLDGTYSLSVRKMDTIKKPIKPSSTNTFLESTEQRHKNFRASADDNVYLPELRGELISGKIFPQDSTVSVNDVKVAISIPDDVGHQLKVVATDATGKFFVNLEKEYNGTQAIVQVLGRDRYKFRIELNDIHSTVYPDITFNRFGITPEMKDMIVDRSVHNQIENGYFQIKPDTLKPAAATIPFYKDVMKVYDLDDYTRFSTISETLVEVIELVWSKKTEHEGHTFQIKEHGYDFYSKSEFKPLVIVDGVLIQDHDHLLEYNARNVKSIGFLRSKYVVGPKIFQGVLNIETIDGDYVSPETGTHRVTIDLFKPQSRKEYFRQRYNEDSDLDENRILDFRYQLLWEPNLDLAKDSKEIVFYTSDLGGTYELILEGFTSTGKPVSIKKKFAVR